MSTYLSPRFFPTFSLLYILLDDGETYRSNVTSMKNLYLLFLLALTAMSDIHAQDSSNASGGLATGPGGSNSFSVGQVVYTEITGPGGSAIQGVQQPYEIFALDGDQFENIRLQALVYPNPTKSRITLRIDMAVTNDYDFELFDVQGRLLQQSKTMGLETVIPMERYPRGTYLLKVRSGRDVLKTFKILKNEI